MMMAMATMGDSEIEGGLTGLYCDRIPVVPARAMTVLFAFKLCCIWYTGIHRDTGAQHCDDLMAACLRRNPWQNVTLGPRRHSRHTSQHLVINISRPPTLPVLIIEVAQKTFTLHFDHMCNLHGQSITATKNGSDNRTWSDNQSKGRRSTLILFLTTAHQATSICPLMASHHWWHPLYKIHPNHLMYSILHPPSVQHTSPFPIYKLEVSTCLYLTPGIIIFGVLVPRAFRKYTTCMVFHDVLKNPTNPRIWSWAHETY